MNLHFKTINLVFILVVLMAHCDENANNSCQNLKEVVQALQEQFGAIQGKLREIEKEKDAKTAERRFIEDEEIDLQATVVKLEKDVKNLIEDSKTAEKRFIADGERDLQAAVVKLEKDVKNLIEGIGSTYVRWGRTTCPGNTTVVYKGYMGGNVYTNNGGPANYLCLPDDPSWAKYQDGIQDAGNKIYGSEYEHHGTNFNPFPKNMMDEDIPCAVCSTKRPLNIMVPARTSCYTGWHLEYTGYLMTVKSSQPAAGEYICMDGNPEPILHGSANTNGNVLYLVEAVCGTLPCLPYVNGRELACSVCSK